ncbi:MAG: thiolase family protein [Pseudomonadota bacterium]
MTQQHERRVVIAGAVRTPIGAIGGGLAPLQAVDLAERAIKGLFQQTGLDPAAVEYTTLGWVAQDPRATNMAKIAAERAGVPQTSPGTTLHENCASGGAAMHDVARRILLGEIELGVAGGAESMSNVPRYLFTGRLGGQLYGDMVLEDGLMGALRERELPDGEVLMGLMTERIVERWGLSREEQDRVAFDSHRHALAAWEEGAFDYVLPVEVPQRRGPPKIVTRDEGPKDLPMEYFAKARPYFKRDGGTVTSQNSSSINDAAAAVILTTPERARALGLQVLAELRAWRNVGVERAFMGEGAFKVIPPLLERGGLRLGEVDFFEINEAFAAVLAAAYHFLPELPREKVNRWGSGISLGHPVGCTGARQVVDMVWQLRRRGARIGVTTRCVGGGIGSGEIVILP